MLKNIVMLVVCKLTPFTLLFSCCNFQSFDSQSSAQSVCLSVTVTDCFFTVITAINKLCLLYLCLSEDDDFETDSYTDRKSPLGFFSKFWELQVGMVLSQRIIFYNVCSLF